MPHLRLVEKLAPDGKHASQAKELVQQIEKLITNEGSPENDDNSKAKQYLAQLKDVRCPQMAQPGAIMPYVAIVNGELERDPPTQKLKKLGVEAIPELIEALEDNTPTRTVYHWRDFAKSRIV